MFKRFGSGLLLLCAIALLCGITLREPVAQIRPDAIPNRFSEISHHYIIGETVRLDINRATYEEFMELPDVGEVLAGRIIAWREAHGSFTCIEDIMQVEGIGRGTFGKISPHIIVP